MRTGLWDHRLQCAADTPPHLPAPDPSVWQFQHAAERVAGVLSGAASPAAWMLLLRAAP